MHVARTALEAAGSRPESVVLAARTPPRGLGGTQIEVDLVEPGVLEPLLEQARPDIVLCLAALSSIDACTREPELAARLNAEVPAELAALCETRGLRLLHTSTDLVFGDRDAPPSGFVEDATPGPLSVYGHTKLAAERGVLEAAPSSLVVRLPLLFGDSGGRGRGASDALLDGLDAGRPQTLFSDEWRTPLEVGEAARLCLRLARAREHRGLVNLPGPERTTRVEFGRRLLAALEAAGGAVASRPGHGTRAEAGMDAERPRDVCLDGSLAARLLGAPPTPLDEAIARAVAARLA